MHIGGTANPRLLNQPQYEDMSHPPHATNTADISDISSASFISQGIAKRTINRRPALPLRLRL